MSQTYSINIENVISQCAIVSSLDWENLAIYHHALHVFLNIINEWRSMTPAGACWIDSCWATWAPGDCSVPQARSGHTGRDEPAGHGCQAGRTGHSRQGAGRCGTRSRGTQDHCSLQAAIVGSAEASGAVGAGKPYGPRLRVCAAGCHSGVWLSGRFCLWVPAGQATIQQLVRRSLLPRTSNVAHPLCAAHRLALPEPATCFL